MSKGSGNAWLKKYQGAIVALLVVVMGFGFSFQSAKAAGTFQLSNFNSTIYGIAGEPLATTINFFYSGDNIPGVSIVGDPTVINEMQLGYITTGGNGYDSITWSGTPAQTGNYPMTLTLTDNYGAFLTQSFNFDVFNQQITIATTTLPVGTVGSNYSASINLNWWGEGTPSISFMGIIPKGISPVQGINNAYSGSLRGGTTTISLSGTPSESGQFPLTLNAEVGTSSASEQFTLDISSSSSQTVVPQPIVSPPAQTAPTTISQTSITPLVKTRPPVVVVSPKPSSVPQTSATMTIASSGGSSSPAVVANTTSSNTVSNAATSGGAVSNDSMHEGFFATAGGFLDNFFGKLFGFF